MRKTKTAVLIVGEGERDQAFLRHLQELYISRYDDIAVKIECGSGGSPRSVVEKAIRLRDNAAYDRCIVIVDKDRLLESDRILNKRIKERPPILIIYIKPCMEGLLLEILEHQNFSRHNVLSETCKHEFARYVPIDRQTDKVSYARIFPKDKLDYRRKKVKDLDIILRIMQV